VHAFAWGVLIALWLSSGTTATANGTRGGPLKKSIVKRRSRRKPRAIRTSKNGKTFNASCWEFRRRLHSRIEARHVMSRKVRAVEPTTSVSDLKAMMETEGFHHLLVMRKDKLLASSAIATSPIAKARAVDIMTAQPKTIFPDTLLSHAITLALHWRISCVPVVEMKR